MLNESSIIFFFVSKIADHYNQLIPNGDDTCLLETVQNIVCDT